MEVESRYPTIITKNNKYYLFINQGNKHSGYTQLFIFSYNRGFNLLSSNIVLNNKFNVSHNFTVIKKYKEDVYYGLGGKFRNQPPWNENVNDHYTGIFLFKSNNLIKWKMVQKDPIITLDYPKNGIYGFEKIGALWDSNICCFYSRILKKYILYVRANLQPHIRFVQYITSDNLINWSPYNKIKVNTHDPNNHNYYTFKVVEIMEYRLFFALSPFTNKKNKPTKLFIKKLISKDGVNWKDHGKLIDGTLMNWCNNRMNTHISEIFYDSDKKKLKIFLQFGYLTNDVKQYILMYTFNINSISDLEKIEIRNKSKGKLLITN